MPRAIDKLRLRFQSLFSKGRVERELSDELRFHLERQIEENRAKGMSAEEARRQALIELGGIEQVKEECRDARAWQVLDETWRDACYAARMMRKSPGFATVAILTLALGIGANTAIFSAVDGILLRPLPYRDSARLVSIWSLRTQLRFEGGYEDEISSAEYVQIQAAKKIFDDVTFAHPARIAILIGAASPRTLGIDEVPANFFTTNGVAPALGRFFTPEDERPGHDHVAILSYRVWQEEFGGSRSAVGKTVAFDQQLYTIVGVMPANFRLTGEDCDVWVPLYPRATLATNPTDHRFEVWARLRRGVALRQAQTTLNIIAQRVGNEFPGQEKGRGLVVRPYLASHVAPVRTSLFLLLGAVGFVLLIACANLSNLLLARGLGRSKELAVRSALGATRWRIARSLLIESLLVALCGGAAGLLCGWWGVRVLRTLAPPDTPRLDDVSLNATVFLYALGAAAFAGILSGLPAALRGLPLDVSVALKESPRNGTETGRQTQWKNVMVGAQVALCVVLLSGSLLAVRSFEKLLDVKLGFRSDHVLAMAIHLPRFNYRTEAQQRAAFRQILDRARAAPGVESAGAEINPILESVGLSAKFRAASGTGPRGYSFFQARYITDDYFHALGIPILRGRSLTAAEVDDRANVAVVNETLAQRLFGKQDPVGSSLIEGLYQSGERKLEIVGVAGDVRDRDVSFRPRATVYLPYYLMAHITLMHLFVRTKTEPETLAATVEHQIRKVDPDIPIADVRTMRQTIAENLHTSRVQTFLFSGFAVLALALVLVGIYGVVAYSANRRTCEMGIRLALGARPGAIARLVIGEAMLPVLLGIAVGFGGSLALTRLMRSLLYEVSPGDPLTLGATLIAMLLAGLAASYFPARRAMRVDPVAALRNE
ncbi:MAG: ABC transporter permease [Acidobacteriota bacterium]|nr:ABC transporter permease [Acidobacteriota bacterium]